MSDKLQGKIDEWWELLLPKQRHDWWCEEGKAYRYKAGKVPAPCPQLWWRLETEYLGDDFKGYVWGYFTTFGKFTADDRRIALLDACIAKAKKGHGDKPVEVNYRVRMQRNKLG